MDKILVKSPFGEIAQRDNGSYEMTDKQVYEALEARGLANAKEVLKTVSKANQELAKDIYEFLGSKVKETLQDQSLVAGTGENRRSFDVLVKKDLNTPVKAGEAPKTITRFGYCVYKEQHKIPEAWKKEDGFLAKMGAEIEAEWNARNK